MTLAELGSLGEFLGGVAVVISLIYVGIQIKQNTTAVNSASVRATIEDANSWRTLLIEHPKIAELYRKGLTQPDSLDPVERLRFRMLLDSLFDTWTWTYQQQSNQGLHAKHVRGTLSRPGGARYWEQEKGRFELDFVRYIDGIGATIGATIDA